MKKLGNPNWILVLPLWHLLTGITKPFEEPDPEKLKFGASWAGLQGLEVGTSKTINSQQKQYVISDLCLISPFPTKRHRFIHVESVFHQSAI